MSSFPTFERMKSISNPFQTVPKVSFVGQKTRPIVYMMSYPGSFSREGVVLSMSVPRGGVNREGGGGGIQRGRYSRKYGRCLNDRGWFMMASVFQFPCCMEERCWEDESPPNKQCSILGGRH